MSGDGNKLFCVHCGKELKGNQRKYCSEAHRKAYARRTKAEGRTDTAQASTQDAITIATAQKLATELARIEGENDAIIEERNRLIITESKLRDELRSAETDAAANKAKLETSTAANEAQTKLLNKTIQTWQLIAGALLLGIIAMAAILIASI